MGTNLHEIHQPLDQRFLLPNSDPWLREVRERGCRGVQACGYCTVVAGEGTPGFPTPKDSQQMFVGMCICLSVYVCECVCLCVVGAG